MTTQTNRMETIYESAAETAKKIRTALKVSFPGVKFSVRSESYSGGSSVNVSWTDLPLTEEVEKVVNQFKSGSFNGMEDIYESTGYMFEGKKYNGAKYIFASRNLSPEYNQQILDYMNANYEEVNPNAWNFYGQQNKAEKEMIASSIKQEEVKEIKHTEVVVNTEAITCTMNLNTDLNGVELKFSAVPSETVRTELKSNGFKWSKYNKVWYAKQSEKTILFAESLVSIYADIKKDIESGEYYTEEYTQVSEPVTTQEITLIEKAAKDGILINDSKLIGRKVLGNWGAMHSFDYGIITGETIYNEVIVKWEEDGENNLDERYYDIKDLIVNKNNGIGVHLLPIENNEPEQVETVTATEQTIPHNKKPAKVLDFNSKFKQKQEKKESVEVINHFTDNILPYLNKEDTTKLTQAYRSNNEKELNAVWEELMLVTAVRRAKDEFLKQN